MRIFSFNRSPFVPCKNMKGKIGMKINYTISLLSLLGYLILATNDYL